MIDLKTAVKVFPSSQPVIVLIRHARRAPFAMNQMIEYKDLSILPEGAREARSLGQELRKLDRQIVFFSSPLTRCVETCQEITRGIGNNERVLGEISPSRYLGDPSAYVLDAVKLGEIMRNYENPIDFLNDWFRGEVSTSAILSPQDGSISLLRWLVDLLATYRLIEPRSIIICVSHDLIITAFLASLFEYNYEELGVVDYLDGAVLWLSDESASSDHGLDEYLVVQAYYSGKLEKIVLNRRQFFEVPLSLSTNDDKLTIRK